VLDLTSLIVVAGIFLGLAVGNAALFGDPVQVQISVPPKVAETGFTGAAAEQVFAAQVAELGQTLSIVDTPRVQLSTRPTVAAALAKPLNLENLVVAIQSQAGVDVVTVRSIMLLDGEGKRLDMMTVLGMPRETPVQFTLSEEDGDATSLVRRSAERAMEWVSPYRLALTHFASGVSGDAPQLVRAREIADRAVARPWVPARATEHVMLHNLMAMMLLLDGNDAAAADELRLTDAIPAADRKAHGVVELGRSFLDVAARRAGDAERHYRAGKTMTSGVHMRGWDARIGTLGALIAWLRGDLSQAEAMLREATAAMPEAEEAHAYLAQLLEAKGDAAGAAAERDLAASSHRFANDFIAIPQSLFWVDPVHGGRKRRS
jgi:hypothetical protein